MNLCGTAATGAAGGVGADAVVGVELDFRRDVSRGARGRVRDDVFVRVVAVVV
jgi:hypothetical protein